LAASLDPAEAYSALLDGLVPNGADWALAATLEADGETRVVATSRPNDDASRAARTLVGMRLDPRSGLARSARSSLPYVSAELDADWFGAVADSARAIFAGLELSSAMTAPVRIDYRTSGMLAAFRRSSSPAYAESDLPMFCELAHRLAVALRNAETYEQERRVADTFQRAALPQALPRRADLSFDAVYEAGRSEALVGGDWYDAVQLAGGRVLVSIGDVSGSGLSAAVTMSLVRQSIRAVAQMTPDPVAILDTADRTLRSHDPDALVTAFVAVLDPFTGELSFAGAGHPPALLRTADGNVQEIWSSGLPLGLRAKQSDDAVRTVVVPRDALLVLYTDGLTETTHDVIEGEAALRAELSRPTVYADPSPAKALRRRLLPNGSRDDVAILTVRTNATADEVRHDGRIPYTWRFPVDDAAAGTRARHEFAAALEAAGFGADEIGSAQLVFGELLGNAIRHGRGSIQASLTWAEGNPIVHVLDEGPGYRSGAAHLPPRLSESGRGLFIVGSIAEDFSVVRRAGGGSHARAVLPATRPARRREVRRR
jgi:anti-sigma regulatory factor (Ser/Thr protein kinase)/GAF domain-containing protein